MICVVSSWKEQGLKHFTEVSKTLPERKKRKMDFRVWVDRGARKHWWQNTHGDKRDWSIKVLFHPTKWTVIYLLKLRDNNKAHADWLDRHLQLLRQAYWACLQRPLIMMKTVTRLSWLGIHAHTLLQIGKIIFSQGGLSHIFHVLFTTQRKTVRLALLLINQTTHSYNWSKNLLELLYAYCACQFIKKRDISPTIIILINWKIWTHDIVLNE